MLGLGIGFFVFLVAFRGLRVGDLDECDDARLDRAFECKLRGNACLASGAYADALEFYADGRVAMQDKPSTPLSSSVVGTLKFAEAVRMLRCALNNNGAQCALQLEDWAQTIRLATEALTDDPGNVKALFRRASALMEKKEMGLAGIDCAQILQLSPGHKAAKLLMEKVDKAGPFSPRGPGDLV